MNSAFKPTILKTAALHALATTAYIVLVVSFLNQTERFFGEITEKTILIPITMLLLFVCSAALTGVLVLGRPVQWFLDGKKKDAITLLFATIGCLFVVALIAFVVLLLIQ
jgi:hypothetical protein